MKLIFTFFILSLSFSKVHAVTCEAAFTFTVDELTIYLDGTSSTGDVTSWHWLIDGEVFSDDAHETHATVEHPGTYEFCLIIETTDGCIDTSCHLITFEGIAEPCHSAMTFTVEGLTIYMDGSTSTGDIASWHWLVDGEVFSDDAHETHTTVEHPGTFEFCLIIETTDGCIDTSCHLITVDEIAEPCHASLSFIVEGLTIYLDGAASTGDISSWHWLIDGEVFSDDAHETHTTVEHPGFYEFCLIIETTDGCIDTICHEITVEEIAIDSCEAAFTIIVDDMTIYLDGTASYGDITSWHWLLDGELFSDDAHETHVTLEHPGTYEICLIIETVHGCIDTFCHEVTIEEIEEFGFKIMAYEPAGIFTIQVLTEKGGAFDFIIREITGNKIFDYSEIAITGSENYTFNIGRRLSPGCYFLTIKMKDAESLTLKYIVLK